MKFDIEEYTFEYPAENKPQPWQSNEDVALIQDMVKITNNEIEEEIQVPFSMLKDALDRMVNPR